MKVYKFGGGILRDSESIRKLTQLIQLESGPLVVVVSALGKTTQALEEILQCQAAGRAYTSQLQALHHFYQAIVDQLLDDSREAAYEVLTAWQEALSAALALPITDASFDKAYSRVVAEGELLTSRMIAYYLQEQQVACNWLDARDYVKTNSGFCRAQVDWEATQGLVKKGFLPLLKQGQVILTQGFVGSNEKGETTTLGKEGSDFTGAILAAALGAASLTIWKDVPGVMSADPKLFKEATKFDRLSYETVGKMAFHGAKVIHPKTIQPLANHNIPLYVKPFHSPNAVGTTVKNEAVVLAHPVYILQEDQVLLQLGLKQLASFNEEYMQEVSYQLRQKGIWSSLMEREAFKLTLCLSNDPYQIEKLCSSLSQNFIINFRQQVNLLTVLHPDDCFTQPSFSQKQVLLAQQRPGVYQAVLSSESQTV